jgi:hypothetical protein
MSICNNIKSSDDYLCIHIAGVRQKMFETTCCHELLPLAQNRISFSCMVICIMTSLFLQPDDALGKQIVELSLQFCFTTVIRTR